ncbi:MAG: DUF2314 domain-containing protein [Ferruginibacter sp.]
MSKLVSAVLFLLLCGACNNANKKAPYSDSLHTITEVSPEDDANSLIDEKDDNITQISSDDEAMNNAIQKAKLTFFNFDTAYKNGHFNKENFSVKIRFDVKGGGEHIWADNITFENGAYFGILDDDASAINKIKSGDRVKITSSNLSDWLYEDNGVMRGGYTIRVLRNKMTSTEKVEFDSSFYLKIED